MTIKVSEDLYSRLEAEARSRGRSISAIIRESLESSGSLDTRISLLDRMRDIVGAVEGPVDLSTNKRYLEDYGRPGADRHRTTRRHR